MESPTPSRRSNNSNGPVPVLNGDLTVDDWKRILRKLTVGAAAETVVANYIYDPICDYGTSVKVLRRVLEAWGELEVDAHGVGNRNSLVPRRLSAKKSSPGFNSPGFLNHRKRSMLRF